MYNAVYANACCLSIVFHTLILYRMAEPVTNDQWWMIVKAL